MKKQNKINFEQRYFRLRRTFFILYLIAIIGFLILGTFGLVSNIKYHMAIREGAKNTVTALEMVVACQQLSNVTTEQIKEQYIKTYILKDK